MWCVLPYVTVLIKYFLLILLLLLFLLIQIIFFYSFHLLLCFLSLLFISTVHLYFLSLLFISTFYLYCSSLLFVSTICFYNFRNDSKPFVVGTYHMPCAFRVPAIMTIHCALSTQHLQKFAKDDPYLLVGDFNIKPGKLLL